MKVARPIISRALQEAGVSIAFDRPLMGDYYYLVTKRVFLDKFVPGARKFMVGVGFDKNIGTLTSHCFHQTIAACVYGWGQQHKYGSKRDGTIAVGMLAFYRPTPPGHVVAVAFYRAGGKVLPVFYNFTSNREYQLTDFEKRNGHLLLI